MYRYSNTRKQAIFDELQTKITQSVKIEFTKYQTEPAKFCSEILGCTLTDQQNEIAQSLLNNKITCIQSANSVGKTFLAAKLGVWFYKCFPNSVVLTTSAPPLQNLSNILWGEIGKTVNENKGLFTDSNSTYLKLRNKQNEKWSLFGRAIPKTGSPSDREAQFSGLHEQYMLFILDEGDAIPEEVYRGIESCMSGGRLIRLLVLFNPRSKTGPVYKLIREGAKVLKLDAFNHPNVISGKEIVPGGAVSREITVERICKYSRRKAEGEEFSTDSPKWFRVPDFLDSEAYKKHALIGGEWRYIIDEKLSYMVLARYPSQSSQQLISLDWIQAAINRRKMWIAQYGNTMPEGQKVMGLDVADEGDDKNAIIIRQGGWTSQVETWDGVDLNNTAERAAKKAKRYNIKTVFVDGNGVGAGVPTTIRNYWRAIKYEGKAEKVMVSEAATLRNEDVKLFRLRDQLAWRCREWLRNDMSAMLPNDQDLIDELTAIEYSENEKGEIIITKKKDLKKALGRSPDKADALFLTFTPPPGFGVL
jgi:hypothetical protein